MKKYVAIFGAVYLLLSIAAAILASVLNVGGTGMVGAALAGASIFAGGRFGKDHSRPPSVSEVSSYSWGSFLLLLAVSAVTTAIAVAYVLPPGESKQMLGLLSSGTALAFMAVFLATLAVMSFWANRWLFAWYARKCTGAA